MSFGIILFNRPVGIMPISDFLKNPEGNMTNKGPGVGLGLWSAWKQNSIELKQNERVRFFFFF